MSNCESSNFVFKKFLLNVLPCLPTEYDAPYSLKSKYSVVIREPLLLLIEKLVD